MVTLSVLSGLLSIFVPNAGKSRARLQLPQYVINEVSTLAAQNTGMTAAALASRRSLPPGEAFNRLAVEKDWYARCDATLGFEHAALAGLGELWHAKATHGLPKWRDFSPRDLAPHMPNMVLFEAVGGPRFRMRLLGTSLMRIYGPADGKFVDEHFSPPVAEVWHASLGATLGACVPLRFKGRVSYEASDFFRVEAVQMPLSETASRADRVLLVMYLLEGPAQHS
jgi:hypothetical protein